MKLRSGRIIVRTVFKNDDERKEYLCDVIKDLLHQNNEARGVEKKIYYAGQVYKIVLAHKEFIWNHPVFKKQFVKTATEKATELKNEIAEKITEGLLSPDNPIYKEAMVYLEHF